MIFLYCFGELFLLFILFLLCSAVTMFNNVLVLNHSSSCSLLMNDFSCFFFFLLPDHFSVHVSCGLFQLVFPSCFSAMKLIHPPSITVAVPLHSPDAARCQAKICSRIIWYNCCNFCIIYFHEQARD